MILFFFLLQMGIEINGFSLSIIEHCIDCVYVSFSQMDSLLNRQVESVRENDSETDVER